MQEETKTNTPMVDIDTSGPEQEVELKEEAQTEEQVETKEEETSPQPQEASDEKQEASKQKEEKDTELENYSKDVQRRIAKLTGKWREAQRQRDEALAFAKAQKTQREELAKKYSSVEQAGVKDREEMIKSGLMAAQTKLATARANDDVAGEVEAQKEIARLGYEEARLVEAKQLAESTPKVEAKDEIPSFDRQPQQQITVDPKAEAWGAQNKWFGSDTAMTYTAFDIHNKLEAEGYDPSTDEYYAEIDKRIRLEFPHKFATTTDTTAENTTKPVQTVASATRSTKSGRKTVRLTPSEVAIAKKLGVSLEDYAKQKKYMKEV